MNRIRAKADDIKDARIMARLGQHRNKPAWVRRILYAYVGLTEREQFAAEMEG